MGEGWKNKIAAFLTAVTVNGHEGAHISKEERGGDSVAKKNINSGTDFKKKPSLLNEFVYSKNDGLPVIDSGIDIEPALAQALPNLVERPEGVNTEEFYGGLTAGDYFFVRQQDGSGRESFSISMLSSVNPDGKNGAEKYNVVQIGRVSKNEDSTFSLVADNNTVDAEGVAEDTGNNVSADNLNSDDLKLAIEEMLKWHKATGEEFSSDSSLGKEQKLSSLGNKINALEEILGSNLSHLKISDKEKERIKRIIKELEELRSLIANSSN